MTLLFFSSVDRYVNLAGQAPIALASDGHNLIFIGAECAEECIMPTVGVTLLTPCCKTPERLE